MNFFEHQDRARHTTRKLVGLFALAIVSLIVITSFLLITVLSVTEQGDGQPGFNPVFLTSDIFLGVTALVISVVLLGTLFRMTQLRGGGSVVAESLGGRLLNMQTRDADERKILNVVEEMAIACGVAVPQVYLLEDPAINAFAAGYKQNDVVIGITRGCIHQLNREELQGVVAHEFSHIFNGDMRLNIRLIGWLYGIMVIGMIGYFILRGGSYHAIGRSRSGKDSRGGILLLGLGLIVVGYGGTFFGNLIKAAVSRQREFLADASAVQFTRNPDGIAGALKKIAGYSEGSLLSSTNASEVSHMLFGQGIKAGFSGMFATHPPLAERIKRIQPRWDGNISPVPESAAGSGLQQDAQTHSAFASAAGNVERHASSVRGAEQAAGIANLVASIGEPSGAHLKQAARHLAAIPQLLTEEVHNTLGACLTVHGLIISLSDARAHQSQLLLLKESLQSASYQSLEKIIAAMDELPRELVLPLVELAIPALRQLSRGQYALFMKHLQQLIGADQTISLFEWSIFKLLQASLDANVGSSSNSVGITQCAAECELLLSALAVAGQTDVADAEAAFLAGAEVLDIGHKLVLKENSGDNVLNLNRALDRLRDLKPLQKPRLLKAMVKTVLHDGVLLPVEGELLRAVAAVLDCPMPPLVQAE